MPGVLCYALCNLCCCLCVRFCLFRDCPRVRISHVSMSSLAQLYEYYACILRGRPRADASYVLGHNLVCLVCTSYHLGNIIIISSVTSLTPKASSGPVMSASPGGGPSLTSSLCTVLTFYPLKVDPVTVV